MPSVVVLIMSDANGQPISLGTGFFVRPGVVATNVHVIAGASAGIAKVVGERQTFTVSGIVGSDSSRDLALLSIPGAAANPLHIAGSDAVSVGDEIFVIGNPQGMEGTLSTGIVSSVRELDSGKLLQITAPISPGSSGGPVLNTAGSVIGVAVATIKGGQNLNLAVPASYLATLLSHPQSPQRLSSMPASTPPDLGRKATEGAEGFDFLWGDNIEGSGRFSFTIRNRLLQTIKNV